MKNKVLIITESTSGGVRRHIVDLIKNIDKNFFTIYLMYSRERADEVFIEQLEILKNECHLIQNESLTRDINLKKDIKAFIEITKIIKTIKPDIVHCHSSKAGALGRISAKLMNTKKIFYTPHAYYFQNPKLPSKKKKMYILIEKLLSKYCTTKTFNVSNGERDYALKNNLNTEKKFITIYNGIDEIALPDKKSIREKLGFKESDFIIGVTARLDDQKDPITFVKIAREVINKNKNVHFLYVGDGPLLKKVEEFIKVNKLEKNIHIMGFRKDAEEIVVAMDLYLITSLYEGMPYSPIEAMRAGIPIIATNTTGNNELVFPGVNGELFEVNDFIKASKLINDLIEYNYISKFMVVDVFKRLFILKIMISKIEKEYLNN